MLDVLSGMCFLLFFGLSVWLMISGRNESDEIGKRRRISIFIAYFLFVSFGAAIGGHSLWPFSSWPLWDRGAVADRYVERIVGVTPDGVEHRIDPRVWQPLNHLALYGYFRTKFKRLGGKAQDSIGAFLLRQANQGLEDIGSGRAPGSWSNLFGPFGAPSHFIPRYIWSQPTDAPSVRFVQIRFYQEFFNLSARLEDPNAYTVTTFFEFPRAP